MNKPWSKIEENYQDSVNRGLNVEAMLNFVRKIQDSPYDKGLYAWTSMHDLCIVQTPVKHPYDGPYLKVSPLFNGKIEFRLIDTIVTKKQWFRVINETEAFSRLEIFIDQLHWFVDVNIKST